MDVFCGRLPLPGRALRYFRCCKVFGKKCEIVPAPVTHLDGRSVTGLEFFKWERSAQLNRVRSN